MRIEELVICRSGTLCKGKLIMKLYCTVFLPVNLFIAISNKEFGIIVAEPRRVAPGNIILLYLLDLYLSEVSVIRKSTTSISFKGFNIRFGSLPAIVLTTDRIEDFGICKLASSR